MPIRRRIISGLRLGLVLIGAALSPAWAGDCRPVRQWSLDFVEGPNGDMLTWQLLGNGHGYFVFDTGSVADLLFADQADALRLPRRRGSHAIVGAGGTETDEAVVDPVSLREYFVVPRSPGGGRREAGVLGAQLYRDHDLELDFRRRKINLYLPEHCAAALVFRPPEFVALPLRSDRFGRAYVTVMLDGRPLNALIDTGATNTALSLAAAKGRFGLSPRSPGVEQAGIGWDVHGNALATYRRRFGVLDIGGIRITDPRVELTEAAWEPEVDLILGMSDIRRLHLFFAFRERKLYAAAEP